MTSIPTPSEETLLLLFKRFDSDGNGLIDEAEFHKILEALGQASPDDVLSLEFAAIDGNSDGCVDFREFSAWWLDRN